MEHCSKYLKDRRLHAVIGRPTYGTSPTEYTKRLCDYKHRGDSLLCLDCESDERPTQSDDD